LNPLVYFRIGYVPLWADDENYINELTRQENMPVCQCSNCAPEDCSRLVENLIHANQSNFDSILDGTFSSSVPYNIKHKYPQKPTLKKKRKFTEADEIEIGDFSHRLVADLHHHYETKVSPGGIIQALDLFGYDDCKAILASLDNINSSADLRGVIGGDCFIGQADWIFEWISRFRDSDSFSSTRVDQVPKKVRSSVTVKASKIASTQGNLGRGLPPRGPTKKAMAAEAARIRSLERKNAKERKDADNERRRQQVSQIMADSKRAYGSI
jgi:hypothetical protein